MKRANVVSCARARFFCLEAGGGGSWEEKRGRFGPRRLRKRKRKKPRRKKAHLFFFLSQKNNNNRYNADGAFAASVLLCLMALGTLYVKDKLERKAVE